MTGKPEIDHFGHCDRQIDPVGGEWFAWDAKLLPQENRRPIAEERRPPSPPTP